jgi:hypothetical protein
MAEPQTPSQGIEPLGCLAALVIGLIAVGGTFAGLALFAGRSPDLSEEWPILLFNVLMVAAPFGLLALCGIRTRLPWAVGIVLTLGLWGWLLLDAVAAAPGRGANIGLGLIMLVSPILVAAAAFAAHALQQRKG